MKRRPRPIPDYKARRLAREFERRLAEALVAARIQDEPEQQWFVINGSFLSSDDPTSWPELH